MESPMTGGRRETAPERDHWKKPGLDEKRIEAHKKP